MCPYALFKCGVKLSINLVAISITGDTVPMTKCRKMPNSFNFCTAAQPSVSDSLLFEFLL